MNDRVVITGLGLVCAIGNNADEWFVLALQGMAGTTQEQGVLHSACYAHTGD